MIKKKTKRLSKEDLKEMHNAYVMQCRITFFLLLFAYMCDFAVKIYLIFKVGGLPLAFVGAIIDLLAKAYHLRNTKFRKDSLIRLPKLSK